MIFEGNFLDEKIVHANAHRFDNDMKICYEPKYRRFCAHSLIHQHKGVRKLKPIIDVLYKESYSKFMEDKECYSHIKKTERIEGIQSILESSIKRRLSEAEDMEKDCRELASFLVDENMETYLMAKDKDKIHSDKARINYFVKKFYFNRDKFTHFFTITFDPEKFPNQEDCERALRRWLSNNAFRKGYKIIGGFERGDLNGRIHFHGMGSFLQEFIDSLYTVKRFSTKKHCWETCQESKTILDTFGINDFQALPNCTVKELNDQLHYICDYIIKSGGKMYYSRALPNDITVEVSVKDVYFMLDDGIVKFVVNDDFALKKDEILSAYRKKIRLHEYGEQLSFL